MTQVKAQEGLKEEGKTPSKKKVDTLKVETTKVETVKLETPKVEKVEPVKEKVVETPSSTPTTSSVVSPIKATPVMPAISTPIAPSAASVIKDKTVNTMSINDLDVMTIADLRELATKLNVINTVELKKSEIILKILEQQTNQGGNIYASGFLEIMNDGSHGVLRSLSMLPKDSDVYVSGSQIKRFNLRKGDFIAGQARPPRE